MHMSITSVEFRSNRKRNVKAVYQLYFCKRTNQFPTDAQQSDSIIPSIKLCLWEYNNMNGGAVWHTNTHTGQGCNTATSLAKQHASPHRSFFRWQNTHNNDNNARTQGASKAQQTTCNIGLILCSLKSAFTHI